MAHLLISAAHKSSGKTTISLGLCAALSERGTVVQPFKKGPDFIDPMWLAAAAGRPCFSLDFHTMSSAEIERNFATRMKGADLGLIEGNKGLYDGLNLDGSNSNAALARNLHAPVVLVLDARGMTRGIAPLILGYQAFEPDIQIRGVILNHLGGSRHEAKLRAVIEHYTDVEVLGAVQRTPALEIVERHLGLVPSNEAAKATQQVVAIGRQVAASVDLQRVVELARTAPMPVRAPPHAETDWTTGERLRIGIARDQAFGFYYPADLEAFVRAGAELVPIDTLHDSRLPAVDGLFLGGGFPESRMAELEANCALRAEIRAVVEADLPVYAECGGLMYLSRSLSWRGRTVEMVGAIPADSVMHARPQGRGYVQLRETDQFPWPRAGAAEHRLEVPAHEFHHSSLENLPPGISYAYQVLRGHGVDGHSDGIVYRNVLAGYAHLSHVEGNPWVSRFLRFVASHKSDRSPVKSSHDGRGPIRNAVA